MVKTVSHITIPCIIFVMLFLSSCSSRDEYDDSETKKETVPAAEFVKQADALYAKRDNLDDLCQSIGLLQRARNAEPKNYEANWKLSQFNYYLAAHTTDDKENEKAFKQGISKKDAKKQLEYVLKIKPAPQFLLEFQESAAQAKKLLDTKF